MRAVILAAGRGSRMGYLTNAQPKCRTKLFGKPLIQWQLDSLSQAGIENVAIVRGYLADSFEMDVKYFDNDRWDETNMVVSLVSADEWLSKYDCIVSYSDIVYSYAIVKKLMALQDDIAIAYDPNWQTLWEKRFEDPLSDAESFKFENNLLLDIGNKSPGIDQIKGQYMGLLRFSPAGWKKVKSYLTALSQKQCDRMDMTMLLQRLLLSKVAIGIVPVDDEWYEVDSENDVRVYESDG